MRLEKTTARPKPGSARRYDDACGAAHALELVGERWALLVIRELMLGPKRFNELRADLPGISANVLTQRLEGLEHAGVLIRRKLPRPASAQVYELTPWGYEAEPIFQTLGRWATRSPKHDPSLPLSAVSLFLSFRTMFDRARAKGLRARVGFRIGAESFMAEIKAGKIDVRRGSIDGAEVVFAGAPGVIAAAVYAGQPLGTLIGAGQLAVDGNRELAERFVGLFPLPPKSG